MKRTVVTRRHRHGGPYTVVAVQPGRGSVTIDNHEHPEWTVGQQVRVRTNDFDELLTIVRVEPEQYGGYTYHFG